MSMWETPVRGRRYSRQLSAATAIASPVDPGSCGGVDRQAERLGPWLGRGLRRGTEVAYPPDTKRAGAEAPALYALSTVPWLTDLWVRVRAMSLHGSGTQRRTGRRR